MWKRLSSSLGRAATNEMRYLPRRADPASATTAQTVDAITAPRIATLYLKRLFSPCTKAAKREISFTGPRSVKNIAKTSETFSVVSS